MTAENNPTDRSKLGTKKYISSLAQLAPLEKLLKIQHILIVISKLTVNITINPSQSIKF
jgi:hypothetical protein